MKELKGEILRLLREDEEFRYAVAGLIGLDEVLKRLDRHGEELVRLREDLVRGFERHDHELAKLREDFNRHEEESAKRFQALEEHLKRHDEELGRVWGELKRLREDFNEGFKRLERAITALGARWGMMAEEAFREGLKGVLEKELGIKVERWTMYDGEGYVYGHPAQVEVDVAVHDEGVILIEVKSSVSPGDIYAFKRKAELYERTTGRRPKRLITVTPFIDEKALQIAKGLGIEVRST